MGLFEKLFKKAKIEDSFSENKLRTEFNLMTNISLFKCLKHENSSNYELIEEGVYEDLKDNESSKFRIAISYELETNEDEQYPLEDILNKYFLHVEDFLEDENDSESNLFKLELGGRLEDIIEVKNIIGKKVFNREKVENGKILIQLVIE